VSGDFIVGPTALPEVFTIERARHGDHRGFLSRLFSADELSDWGWDQPIAQINHTYTAKRGTIRGMHFQVAPKVEKKIIMCLKGAICDVAVDLRRGSPAFLRHHMETLSADNRRALLIPEGCGHGFQTLTDDVELIYLHSEYYSPDHEGGVSALDPMLAIPWPEPVGAMSDRDKGHPPLTPSHEGLRV
jgi:dTDP-4-dehydrorhamnose 3,5-epimerase